MNRFSNGWRLAGASWRLLSRDRALVAIPALLGLLSVVVFFGVAVPGLFLLGDGDATEWAGYLLVAVASMLALWVSTIGQAAVMAGAARRMDGGEPTVGTSLATALHRGGRLLEWALLSTVVALVLDAVSDRLGFAGQILGSLGNLAFRVLSFLALPVIVFEDVGAIEGFRRSSRLLRSTWGEQLMFTFGIGALGFLAGMLGFLVALTLVLTEVTVLAILGVVVGGLWILAVVTVTSALSAVFKAALYRHAHRLPVDPSFDPEDLDDAFVPRRGGLR